MANQKITEIIGDGAIKQLQDLVKGLDTAKIAMEGATEAALKMQNATGAKNLKEVTSAQKALTQAVIDYEKQQQAAQKTAQELIKTELLKTKAAKEAAKAQEQATKASEKAAKEAEQQASAYTKLSKQLNDARKAAKDLAAQYGINSTEAKKAAAGVQELDKKVKAIDASVGQHQRNVGNYSDALKGVGLKLLAAGGAMLSFTALVNGAKSIIQSSEALSDKWAKTTGGLSNAWVVLKNSIANMEFGNLFANLVKAVKLGEDYAEVLDLLQDKQRGVSLQAKQDAAQIAEWRVQLSLGNKTLEEKAALNQKIIDLERNVGVRDVQLAAEKREELIKSITATKQLNREQLESFISFASGTEKQLALVEQYNKLLKERTDLQAAIAIGGSQGTETARLAKVNAELAKVTQSAKDFDKVLKALSPEEIKALEESFGNVYDSQTRNYESIIKLSKQQEKLEAGAEKAAEGQRAVTGETIKAAKALGLEADALNPLVAMLIKMGASAEDVIEFNKKLIESTKTTVKDQFEIRKGGAEKLKELNAKTNQDELADAQQLADGKAKIESTKQALINETFQLTQALVQRDYTIKKTALDEELAALEKQHDLKLISDEKYYAKKEELDKKARKLERDAAIKQRAVASFQAAVNTATAVTNALAVPPPPVGMALAILMGALGAVQIGIINSQPLPKLAKGIKNSPAMFAEVGEAGPELVESGGKSQVVSQSTKMFLPKGSNVIPLKGLAEAAGVFRYNPSTVDGKSGVDLTKMTAQIARDNEELRKVIRDKESVSEVKMKGMYDSIGFSIYVDQNFRH